MNLKSVKASIHRNKNIGLYITLFSFTFVYIFFFMSPFVMPGSSKVNATPLFSDITCQDGNTIRLIRSEYSESQSKMQYEFDIKSDLLRPYDFKIKFRTRTGSVQEANVNKVIEEADIYIIDIDNVIKKWTEIQIEIIGMNNDNMSTVAYLYSDRNSITLKDTIDDKSANEYKIDKANLNIDEYTNAINNLNADNDTKWYEIGLLRNLNEQLENRKRHETSGEQSITDNSIKSNINSISNYYSNIVKNENEIKEYEQKIAKASELIKELSQWHHVTKRLLNFTPAVFFYF